MKTTINEPQNSKIIITNVIGFVAMIGASIGLDIDPHTRADLVTGIGAAQAIITTIWRWWFTKP